MSFCIVNNPLLENVHACSVTIGLVVIKNIISVKFHAYLLFCSLYCRAIFRMCYLLKKHREPGILRLS